MQDHEKPEAEERLRAERARLAVMPPFLVQAVDDQTGEIRDWFWGPVDVEHLAMIDESSAARQTAFSAEQLARWGRAAAAMKRVWRQRDRELTQWKAAVTLEIMTPPGDAKDWKQPTEKKIEATYRARPEYERLNQLVERAEEAHSACLSVISAWERVSALTQMLAG